MIETLFRGLFDSEEASVITVSDFLLCIGTALLCGLILSLLYMYHTRYTASFVVTLALLPTIVCVVIMMVSGNIGTAVAVAGAFSLVRFRSVPGTAREIGHLFIAMGAGLVAGMGYLAYALLFTLILGLISMLYSCINYGARKKSSKYKTLHITVPEDLDYDGVFDEILSEYADSWELAAVKTTDMGSLFKLTYNLTLKEDGHEKEMIDKLRCRNGNLEISITTQQSPVPEL